MKQVKPKPNVFVVDTPYQLLNAVEAVHSLQLKNNHLFVVWPKNWSRDRLTPLIKKSDWTAVNFPAILIDSGHWVRNMFGSCVDRWYCRYLHFRRMRTLAKLVRSVRHADKVFLGHYWEKEKSYMRHIANAIEYNTLYILDDGTDTLDINGKRNQIGRPHIEKSDLKPSVWARMREYLRAKYWDYNVADAPNITFFTLYNIEVRNGDRLIRNEYSYLRSLAPAQQTCEPDTVLFIGQCMVDDGYLKAEVYLDFLSKIREHFRDRRFLYVPHPRESGACAARAQERLQCHCWPTSSVIEYDLVVRGFKPKIVAGFLSSALISLASLLDQDVEIACFYISPKYWTGWTENAIEIYNYVKEKAQPRVTLLSIFN